MRGSFGAAAAVGPMAATDACATETRAGMPEVEQRREQLPGAVADDVGPSGGTLSFFDSAYQQLLKGGANQ